MARLRQYLAAARYRLGDAVQNFVHSYFLPMPRRDDDLYLVAFPKSGVTWFTFLVGNTNLLLNDDPREITFFNNNDFVPDVQFARRLGAPLLPIPGYRCFKSHAPYIRLYHKVFYLVRDPRNVMMSYFLFLTSLGWWNGTLEQLIRHPRFGIRAWNAHVTSWLDGVDPATCFSLIRYEDLMADTVGQLRHLYRLLGIPVSDPILMSVVERCSPEKMRAAEMEGSSTHPIMQGIHFIRPGQLGGPRKTLPDDLRRLIEDQAGPVMRRLGYDPSGDAAQRVGPNDTR